MAVLNPVITNSIRGHWSPGVRDSSSVRNLHLFDVPTDVRDHEANSETIQYSTFLFVGAALLVPFGAAIWLKCSC